LQFFLQKILVQTALQDSAALVRKVNFYFYFSSLNKHTNKNKKTKKKNYVSSLSTTQETNVHFSSVEDTSGLQQGARLARWCNTTCLATNTANNDAALCFAPHRPSCTRFFG
jgi:hypothetical protein